MPLAQLLQIQHALLRSKNVCVILPDDPAEQQFEELFESLKKNVEGTQYQSGHLGAEEIDLAAEAFGEGFAE